MKSINRFFKSASRFAAGLVLLAAFLFIAPPDVSAQTLVSPVDFGMTNSLTANATQTVNLGNAISTAEQREIGLVFSFTGAATNAGNITLTFARSADGVKWETTPKFTWVVPLDSTNAVVGVTNLTSSTIGSFAWLKLVSAANSASAANTPTSVVLEAVKKRDRNVQ